jgi:hypothetical protein
MFGRITQKWPSRKVSDGTNQRPNSRGGIFFHEVFPERDEKAPQTALLPLLSLINELKLDFLQILTLKWLKNRSNLDKARTKRHLY